MPPVLEFFPEQFIALDREVSKHLPLVEELSALPHTTSFEERLAHIATYCDTLVDGTFTQKELCDIADILTRTLIEKRTGLLLVH
jgi:hypothetical protein